MQDKSDIKILVVDDREDNLFSIETILQKDSYTIVKANSGRAALKTLLKEDDFSLILMDVQMPDINGFETATIIYERDKLKNIPIIFITAHNYGDEYVFKGYKTGGVDYIYKPFNPELLRAKVSVFAELYRKNQELLANERKLKAANIALQKEIEERRISEEKIKMLNTQLVHNNNELKAINLELDRFAFVASHDLQEPLRKIMLFSDKISIKNNVDEEVAGYLQKIVNSSQRMQALIDDILRFSRHDVHSDDFIESELNILVSEAVSEIEIEIEKTKARVNIHLLPKVPVIPALIRQLFYNLISNAIKFRKQDAAPVINIYSEKISSSEINVPVLFNDIDYYKISIEDNGIGFDSVYAEDIFVVFKRLHSYHEYEGTGVGLSICKKIMEKHNGLITVESKKNKGSTFMIWLPEKANLLNAE
ncbi:MAG TPA: response regulator [Chitinophagaceae bacterium]